METGKPRGIRRKGADTDPKRQRWLVAMALLVFLLALILVGVLWWLLRSSGGVGSRIVPMGEMTANEARAALDEEMQKSRVTISLAPAPILGKDKSLAIGFEVVPGNNGFSERFELMQDDRVIYASDIVAPGNKIEAVIVPEAHVGPAIATVFAVGDDGADKGNPVSVELEVTE